MSEFQVTVYTRVKELYYVEADSAEDAKENWHNGEPDVSECIDVDDVIVEEVDHD